MSRETDITNLIYNETQCDINRLKYRSAEFDPVMADRLLMIQEEKGAAHALRYFRWRIEGSITYQEFFHPSMEIRENTAEKELHEIKSQLKDMQQLLLNLVNEKNDELRERRSKMG